MPVSFVATGASGTLGGGYATVTGSGTSLSYVIAAPVGTTELWVKPHFYLAQNISVNGGGNTITLNLGGVVGGDVDDNNQVDGTDYAWLRYYWDTAAPQADLNGDGMVNAADYAILKDGWYQKGAPHP